MPITVRRLSDNTTLKVDLGPGDRVGELKRKLRADFPPHHPNGCRIVYNHKVLKSIHRMKHYGIKDNDEVHMDDTKNWSSSSSSSDSDD